MSENNDEFDDDQIDNYIGNYTSLPDGKPKTSTRFPTGETPDETPTPQTRTNNFENARFFAYQSVCAPNYRRLQAKMTQTCGSYCHKGIQIGDFIEKPESESPIDERYQFWRHWNCGDPRGETFNYNIHERRGTTATVHPTTTSPVGSSHYMGHVPLR